MMNDDSKEAKLPNLNFLDEKLFKSRSISIFGQINERAARSVMEQLLALSAEGSTHLLAADISPSRFMSAHRADTLSPAT